MSTHLRILPFIFLSVFVFSSCQKEVDFDTPVTGGSASGGAASGIFTAKVDGVQYTAEAASGSILRGTISITARTKEKKFFVVTVTDTVTGTYVLDQASIQGAMAYIDSTDANKIAFATNEGSDSTQAGGQIIIRSIDKVKKIISGTFSCKMFRDMDGKQKVITEGSFSVPFTSALPVARTTDTFRVKIDGVSWNAKSITAAVSGGLLIVNGSEPNLSKVMGFQLPQAIAAGTYDFSYTGDYVALYLPDGSTPYLADSGKLTILERNISTRRVRANFNFIAPAVVGTDAHQITEGYFSVTY